ncbi:GlsB/YeaQ/YmgE family stress response membrane protein [Cellulomonas edaphi]|uniref:GlsB/YeaQ/YmgE family stress response membrane protein n=1 Tax=Cellulomonas edaphi TaxID=3053468 RepID=A0ABT7S4U5_9CELL|nr:GlsB/YeaQ/YmgE family stress response membrane protein [Cellulomons edaphi]MDM7830651.1 GlsB/YeaQ/YmgE family stress response membrane protein [Cellulomons edaphi]
MTIEGIISAIVIGAIIGALARLILPGKQNISVLVTIIVGIVAALLGTLIVGSLRDTDGIDWIEIAAQLVLAVIGVALVSGRKRR